MSDMDDWILKAWLRQQRREYQIDRLCFFVILIAAICLVLR